MGHYNGEFVSLTINMCQLFAAHEYAFKIWTEATQYQLNNASTYLLPDLLKKVS